MKGFKVAEARARFGEILDRAEQGDEVFIERNGVRFRVAVERGHSAAVVATPAFGKVNADVLSGEWSWSLGERGLRFRARRTAR